MITIQSILFDYKDGRKNKVKFTDVPFNLESAEELEKLRDRLPTEAELTFTYTENAEPRNIHSYCPDAHIREVEE